MVRQKQKVLKEKCACLILIFYCYKGIFYIVNFCNMPTDNSAILEGEIFFLNTKNIVY